MGSVLSEFYKIWYSHVLSAATQALLPLFIETEEGVLGAVWAAVGAATGAVPKELGPAFVRTVKDGIATAVERQRRKRLPGPLLLPGLCLPKALAPLLPVYLQGVLQVRPRSPPACCPSRDRWQRAVLS